MRANCGLSRHTPIAPDGEVRGIEDGLLDESKTWPDQRAGAPAP